MRRLHRVTQCQQLVGTQVGGHLNDRVHEIRLTRRATHRGGTVQPGDAHQLHAARHQIGDGTLQGVFAFAQVRAQRQHRTVHLRIRLLRIGFLGARH